MRHPSARHEAHRLAAQETAGQLPQACPLCGTDMEPGCLFSGKKNVFWYPVSPHRRWRETPIKIDVQGVPLEKFKTAWFCRSCGKMIFTASGGDGGPAPA